MVERPGFSLDGVAIPVQIASRILVRTALLWFVVRVAVLFATKEFRFSLAPTIILVCVVVFLRYLDGTRRKEFIFLQNLGVHPILPISLATSVTALLEAAVGALIG